jgi:hypothetical protein
MRAATHLGSDRAAFGAHPFLPGNATDPEAAVPRSHACVREAEKSEHLRLPFAALHHEIVGVASEKNVPTGMSSPPLVRSQIKDVMQVDVGERGDTVAPCGTPSSGNVHDLVLQRARDQPLLDQPQDPSIRDTVQPGGAAVLGSDEGTDATRVPVHRARRSAARGAWCRRAVSRWRPGAQRASTRVVVVTVHNLRHVIRQPQLLIFSTIQPIMFVSLFVYAFGGAVKASLPRVTYIDFLLSGIFVQSVGVATLGRSSACAGQVRRSTPRRRSRRSRRAPPARGR